LEVRGFGDPCGAMRGEDSSCACCVLMLGSCKKLGISADSDGLRDSPPPPPVDGVDDPPVPAPELPETDCCEEERCSGSGPARGELHEAGVVPALKPTPAPTPTPRACTMSPCGELSGDPEGERVCGGVRPVLWMNASSCRLDALSHGGNCIPLRLWYA